MSAEELDAARPGQLAAFEAFCAELGHPAAQVALAWLLHQPAVIAPIAGPRTLAGPAGRGDQCRRHHARREGTRPPR
jgi:aryl-alcohol dehydrogenase-like predicted oxidoreductase